jgi:predicted NUDIX family NTP pyrophosphohydrolase
LRFEIAEAVFLAGGALMAKRKSQVTGGLMSAGILLYRSTAEGVRMLLAHPGGPFFAKKDDGAWSIPKGLLEADEDPAAAAVREFEEELGWRPAGEVQPLGEVRLKSGKRVIAFALASDEPEAAMLARFSPGMFQMEWPPRSGRSAEFPEVDRIAFFSLDEAARKLNPAQAPLIERLKDLLG